LRSAVTSLEHPALGDPLAPVVPLATGEPLAPAELLALAPVVALAVGVPVADVVAPGLGLLLPPPHAAMASTTAVSITVHRLVMCPPRSAWDVRGNQRPRRRSDRLRAVPRR
jgi:hypothetical protein